MKHLKLFNSFINEENREKAFEVILKNPDGGMTERVVLLAKTKEDASKKAANLKEYKQYGYVVTQIQSIEESTIESLEEGVVSIKGGRILAHKILNKLVDMEIILVKKKTEDLVEAIASLLATTSMSESRVNEGAMSDIDSIAQEAKDFKSFVKEFKKEYKNMDAGNPKELEAWLQSVYDAAKEGMGESKSNLTTFKKSVIHAMIAQEA